MCCGTWEPRRRHKLADKESKADNSKVRDSKVRDREIRDRKIRVDRSTMNQYRKTAGQGEDTGRPSCEGHTEQDGASIQCGPYIRCEE